MRGVILGANTYAQMTAKRLADKGHEVVVIEQDEQLIQELSDEMDCGFIQGDGSKPEILKEANPKDTDVLFALTDSDQVNIIASLVGRSLGFQRVITKIETEDFEHICLELGLKDTIVPARMIARYLVQMFSGQDLLELSAMVKGDARLFSFVASSEELMPLRDLELPEQTRVVCLYRNNKLILPEEEPQLKEDDEVVLITTSKHLPELTERWNQYPKT